MILYRRFSHVSYEIPNSIGPSLHLSPNLPYSNSSGYHRTRTRLHTRHPEPPAASAGSPDLPDENNAMVRPIRGAPIDITHSYPLVYRLKYPSCPHIHLESLFSTPLPSSPPAAGLLHGRWAGGPGALALFPPTRTILPLYLSLGSLLLPPDSHFSHIVELPSLLPPPFSLLFYRTRLTKVPRAPPAAATSSKSSRNDPPPSKRNSLMPKHR